NRFFAPSLKHLGSHVQFANLVGEPPRGPAMLTAIGCFAHRHQPFVFDVTPDCSQGLLDQLRERGAEVREGPAGDRPVVLTCERAEQLCRWVDDTLAEEGSFYAFDPSFSGGVYVG